MGDLLCVDNDSGGVGRRFLVLGEWGGVGWVTKINEELFLLFLFFYN